MFNPTIKIIKLLNGQDLIAELLFKNEHHIRIKNPVLIMVIPSRADPKNPSVGFAPWAEFSEDKEIELATNHILAIMTPIDQFISQYKLMFSGLVLPKNNLILTGEK